MSASKSTRVTEGPLTHIVLWVFAPLIGGLAGWFLPPLAGWVGGFSWFPFSGPFRFVEETVGTRGSIALVLIGIAAGIAFVLYAYYEMLSLVVDDRRLEFRVSGDSDFVDRQDVEAVFIDGKYLVALGADGRLLARLESGLEAARLQPALTGHGYPWRDEDPYADEYVRWAPDTDALPVGANALFEARQKALDQGDSGEVLDFTLELSKLGVTARDEKKRQYWRLVDVS